MIARNSFELTKGKGPARGIWIGTEFQQISDGGSGIRAGQPGDNGALALGKFAVLLCEPLHGGPPLAEPFGKGLRVDEPRVSRGFASLTVRREDEKRGNGGNLVAGGQIAM